MGCADRLAQGIHHPDNVSGISPANGLSGIARLMRATSKRSQTTSMMTSATSRMLIPRMASGVGPIAGAGDQCPRVRRPVPPPALSTLPRDGGRGKSSGRRWKRARGRGPMRHVSGLGATELAKSTAQAVAPPQQAAPLRARPPRAQRPREPAKAPRVGATWRKSAPRGRKLQSTQLG